LIALLDGLKIYMTMILLLVVKVTVNSKNMYNIYNIKHKVILTIEYTPFFSQSIPHLAQCNISKEREGNGSCFDAKEPIIAGMPLSRVI